MSDIGGVDLMSGGGSRGRATVQRPAAEAEAWAVMDVVTTSCAED